jgi:hypothetical protein
MDNHKDTRRHKAPHKPPERDRYKPALAAHTPWPGPEPPLALPAEPPLAGPVEPPGPEPHKYRPDKGKPDKHTPAEPRRWPQSRQSLFPPPTRQSRQPQSAIRLRGHWTFQMWPSLPQDPLPEMFSQLYSYKSFAFSPVPIYLLTVPAVTYSTGSNLLGVLFSRFPPSFHTAAPAKSCNRSLRLPLDFKLFSPCFGTSCLE